MISFLIKSSTKEKNRQGEFKQQENTEYQPYGTQI